MKKNEDKNQEYMGTGEEEPENEERGLYEDGGDDDGFEGELDEKTLRFVQRVLFPSVIALVVVIVVVAAVFLYRSGKKAEKEAVLASAEQEEQDTPENQERLPGQTIGEMEKTQSEEADGGPEQTQSEETYGTGKSQSEKTVDESGKSQPEKTADESGENQPEKTADESGGNRPEKTVDESGGNQPEKESDGTVASGFEKTAVSDKENPDAETDVNGQLPAEAPNGTEKTGGGETASDQNEEVPEETPADAGVQMSFTDVSEEVTAKEATNLRNIPSQGSDSAVVYTLQNGETLSRTGVSDSGWSRLTYNGQTVYAVSSYLTTDLAYQAPKAEAQEGAGSGDGIKTKFSDRNEQVTAKIEVNLRVLPSVTNPDAVVAAVLHNGEYVTRTGINEDYGWSRVDYNGQTLYCVSSYLCE